MYKYLFGLCFLFVISCAAQRSVSQKNSSTLVADVVKETNQLRKVNGLTALVAKEDLNVLAQKHSADMASGRVEFSHNGFEDRSKKAAKIIADHKGGFRFAENVAYGSKTAREVLKGWENSPGHRKNILGNYKYIGVGIAADKNGRLYFTQIFVN